MDVLIVGAGKVGRYLLNNLLKKGHEIVVIDQDEEKCQYIKNKFDVRVICGDGSKSEVLEKAGAQDADILLAVTRADQDNLVICQLAERQFGIPQTLTRVNTPGNEKLFNWLGVNVAVSSASILSALVDQEVAINDLKSLLNKDQDQLKLVRIPVNETSALINSRLKDIDLPLESVLVTILREESAVVPRGNTRILAGDLIVALTKSEFEKELLSIFN